MPKPASTRHAPADEKAAARRRATLRRRLLAWYDANRRDLPWRRTDDPYSIWLSETMLQQTQVATVIPYYRRFLDRYPTVDRLAAAPLDDVLRLWAGLGYYSRARNLHKAAAEITNRYSGRFPQTVESLRTLPGVGRYTAGAVASIAFGARVPVVDGNVARVLSRLFEFRLDVRTPQGDTAIWEHAESLLPRQRVGDFNQALMELGATICRPADAAQCLMCPLRTACAAAAAGTVASLPVRRKKTPVKNETHVVLVADRGGKRLFRRRPAEGLWGGLWELPSVVQNGRSAYATAKSLAKQLFDDDAIVNRRRVGETSHVLTHRRIRFIAYRAVPRTSRVHAGATAAKWLKRQSAARLGVSTAMRRLIAAIPEMPSDSNGHDPSQRR